MEHDDKSGLTGPTGRSQQTPSGTTSTKLPNLLIAGVQKGGTTWLHRQLAHHPDIFMARTKELGFFNSPARVRSEEAWSQYLENFSRGATSAWRGESTPHYFLEGIGNPHLTG